ncbi:helix-turn-helix transcriptional regulator [Staphylococcus sp. FSL W8-0774]|uniref:helix-turn-helix transcriptional regulator n=1 Tax=Staphylococcus sp. FSL W8-0774 TaxID=2954632 RepID=UPI0030F914FB
MGYLRDLRKSRKLTQVELAELLDTNRYRVIELERSNLLDILSYNELEELATLFDKDVNQFINEYREVTKYVFN